MIYTNLLGLIGKTPMVELTNYNNKMGLEGRIIAKLESYNPMSSVKDRVAYYMIKQAEEKGSINKDTVIVEPTSGNTGIGLAYICAIKGYKLILTMPETMSQERKDILKALGAEIELTDGLKGMSGAVDRANELASENENVFLAGQFSNPANLRAHIETTAPEILEDTKGDVAVFVAGFGTGGTVSGVGKVLKEYNKDIRVVGVEPKSSPLVSEGKAAGHKIQGIGANFIPDNLNIDILDEIISVSNEDAIECTKAIAKTDGIFVGISSGATLYAATEVAKRKEYRGKNIIVIFPDTGERYLSTGIFG